MVQPGSCAGPLTAALMANGAGGAGDGWPWEPAPHLGGEPNFHAWMEQRRWERDRCWQTRPGSGELRATLGGCSPCLVAGRGLAACPRCPFWGSAASWMDPRIRRSWGILLPWMGKRGWGQGWGGCRGGRGLHPISRTPYPAPRILHPVSCTPHPVRQLRNWRATAPLLNDVAFGGGGWHPRPPPRCAVLPRAPALRAGAVSSCLAPHEQLALFKYQGPG